MSTEKYAPVERLSGVAFAPTPVPGPGKIPQKIILAAGHGGKDSGAVSPDGKHKERDQAVYIVDHMAEWLRPRTSREIIVAPHQHDTHETVHWLNQRFMWADAWALEIHRDSASTITEPAASFRCGMYHGSSAFSKSIAEYWAEHMRQTGAHPSTWARPQNAGRFTRLQWIAQPKCLSHLIELGFMEGRNTDDHLLSLAHKAAAAVLACTVNL